MSDLALIYCCKKFLDSEDEAREKEQRVVPIIIKSMFLSRHLSLEVYLNEWLKSQYCSYFCFVASPKADLTLKRSKNSSMMSNIRSASMISFLKFLTY